MTPTPTGADLLQSIPLGMLVTDTEGNISHANTALLALLERPADDVIGSSLAALTPQEDHGADDTAVTVARKGDQPAPYFKDLLTGDGQRLPVETHVAPLVEDGLVTGIIHVVRELTDEMAQLQQLQRRTMHLVASSEVAKATTQILDPDELLARTVELIRQHFGYYYVAIFLIDESGEWAELQAATGEAGQRLLAGSHRLGVGSNSMVGYVTGNNQARIALDVGEEAIRFDNPELPKTRSEIALPLRARGDVIGALDAQSTSLNAFSSEDIQTIQMMADQVAIAIQNARLFSQIASDDT